jgi:adenine-specific DNA-methyltransferase
MSEHLDMQTPNWANLNSQFIADRFPNCVTETAEGIKIDFDLLKQELSNDLIEGNKERYRLEWPGKKEAIVMANLPTTKTLRPVREDSVDFDNTENLYIEGDNLEVLKLLQESYLGKIKMIYIDPPYNTGKDFVYKDNFSKDAQEELIESGQKDEYNQRLVVNPETAGRYHSDWLTMMYPRLKLARNLLTDDGSIFISIDDNEIHNLKKICDDIFGPANFIANVIWQKKFARQNDATYFSTMHDYILVYAKNAKSNKNDTRGFELNLLPRTEEDNSNYKNPDNDSRGPWISVDLSAKSGTEKLRYKILTPGGAEYFPSDGRFWAVSQEKLSQLIADNRIWFGVDKMNRPRIKTFLSEVQNGMTPNTIWFHSEVSHTQESKQSLKKLFNEVSTFDTPKPVELIKRIIYLATKENDIILDFFSGSATTGHAVMQLNADEGFGKRKYIQVQIPEVMDSSSEAYKAGYTNLCEIGKERLRKAAQKIKEEAKSNIDYGFRVYRLDESNMQDVFYRPNDYKQSSLELFTDNVKPDRTADDLLSQLMLDWGLPLSLKIEQENVSGKFVFKVAGNSLFAYFDNNIDEAFAKELAKEEPLRIVFKDSGFKDDTAKTNVKQLLKQLSPNTEMKVL